MNLSNDPANVVEKPKPGILIVDDDDSLRTVLASVLRQEGFTVWTAATGGEAIELYYQHQSAISLVFLDVVMPGLDGEQTLRALQKINPAVRSCFLTTRAGPYSKDDLLKRGTLRVFSKPFIFAAFVNEVKKLVAGGNPNLS